MSNKMFFSPIGTNTFLPNLVAYYKVDTNSNDFSGNGNNGTDTSISYAIAGKVGNSADFNGSTSKIIVPQSTDFDFSDAVSDLPFTISFWINAGNNFLTQWVFAKDGATRQWIVAIEAFEIKIILFTNGSNYKIYSTSISPSVYTHFVMSYDGTDMKIYKNGIEGHAATTVGTYTKMPIDSQVMDIGVKSNINNLFFGGQLDEAYFYKGRNFTATEALLAYNEGVLGQTLI